MIVIKIMLNTFAFQCVKNFATKTRVTFYDFFLHKVTLRSENVNNTSSSQSEIKLHVFR